MLLSKYFLPIIKETPRESSILSHTLMLKAGLIRQVSAGIYTWLPFGLKVLENITEIVDRNMQKFGGIKLLMPTIQPQKLWEESNRLLNYGNELLKITDRHGNELLYAPTAEEVVTSIFKDNVTSYKSLPLNLYQTHWKFRDEIRPRFGVMRGREFLMKDAYSFDLVEEDAISSYKKMFVCYLNIFTELGLSVVPMLAANGAIGGNLSHEFIVLAQNGESNVYYDKRILNTVNFDNYKNYEDIFQNYTKYYANTEDKFSKYDEIYMQNKDYIVEEKGIEVAHIFYFGDKYSKSMNVVLKNSEGKDTHVLMASYGIGISRLVGAIIESSHDENGIIWSNNISPFLVIINALGHNEEVMAYCHKIYNILKENFINVLFNDKDSDSSQIKLTTADLIGIPYQINIGTRSFKENMLEFKVRKTNLTKRICIDNITEILEILIK